MGNAVLSQFDSGTAYITGRNEFLIEPDDPLSVGFMLR